MRIRTIKPEWLDDERLAMCSDAARVLSVALITLSDDAGRGRLGVVTAARVFPSDPSRFTDAFAELDGWYATQYEVRGQTYFEICNFSKHQVIDRRRFRTLTPEPENANDSGMQADAAQMRRSSSAPALRDLDLDLDLDREQDRTRSREDWQRVAGLFAKRYEAARGLAWHYGPHVTSLEDIATQARSQAGDFDANVGQALDSFFADEWAQGADYPPGLLAKQFGKHFKPPGDRDKVAAEQKRQREQADAEALQRKLDGHAKDAYVPSEDEIADMVGDFGKGLRGQA